MLDCSYSVSETEKFHHGDLKSDITHCGYDYIHEKVKNETDKEIELRFYGLYLKLKPVSYFKVFAFIYNTYSLLFSYCKVDIIL